jgi:hypothetical protein
MKSKLKNLSAIVASANDSFQSKFNKALRNQGMKADAITIDCIAQDKRIVILIHDDKPDLVDIALGNKEGDIYSSSEYEINKISEAVIVEMMEVNFISSLV